MKKKEARELAISLMIKHKLFFEVYRNIETKYHPPYVWKIKFNKSKKNYGLCDGSKRVIYLSKTLLKISTEEEVLDTILHEIAHAIVGYGFGHGKKWKEKAIEIGCKSVNY